MVGGRYISHDGGYLLTSNLLVIVSHLDINQTLCTYFFSVPQEGVKTENNEHINLKVAGQDGSVVQFKIKRHTPLSKLMKAYCERQVRLLQSLHWFTDKL